MKRIGHRVWSWVRLGLLLAAGLYLLAVVLMNSSKYQAIWYWRGSEERQTSIVMVMGVCFLCGAVLGPVAWYTLANLLRVRERREARAARTLDREIATLNAKAARVQLKPARHLPLARDEGPGHFSAPVTPTASTNGNAPRGPDPDEPSSGPAPPGH